MKRITLLGLAVFLFSCLPAFAGPFGAAESQTKPGQFSLGAGVFRYADEWDFDQFTADAQQVEVFLQLNLGLFPGWETYLRVGAADLKVDGAMAGDSDFDDDFGPFATLGVKGLFLRGEFLDLGGFIEGSYFDKYSDSSTRVSDLEIDETIAVNAGITLQKEIEGALLYGGPFFHFREADFSFAAAPGSGLSSFSGEYESEENFGGFLGIRWVALEDLVIEAELQLRNKLSAGATLSFLF